MTRNLSWDSGPAGQPAGQPLHDLLEVVQQQQELSVSQSVVQDVEQGVCSDLTEAKRLGDGWQHQGRIADGGQIHEVHPIGEGLAQVCRDLQAQAGFAHAARTRQRQQAHLAAQQEVFDNAALLSRDQRAKSAGWAGCWGSCRGS